ncbi:MAG: L-ribulose-5-phosphate 4-epimerase AraD [Candidatus Woesearchaeota archaeon]
MMQNLKEIVCKANKELVDLDLVIFTWGNASAIDREKGLIAIKPSGIPYSELKPEDIPILDLDGKIIEGEKIPSSDTATHLELYKNFKEISAIVHTHSPYATIFAQAKKPIPCLGTTHADHFYGQIPVTRDLSIDEIKEKYESNTGKIIVELFNRMNFNPTEIPACLVSSHGPFVWGKSMDEAIHNSAILEYIARLAFKSIALENNIGSINQELLDRHYLRKNGPSSYYGQRKTK